jgi:hypothetical protein
MKQEKTLPDEVMASIVVDVITQVAIKPWKFKVCKECGAILGRGEPMCSQCKNSIFETRQKKILNTCRGMVSKDEDLLELFDDLVKLVEHRKSKIKGLVRGVG